MAVWSWNAALALVCGDPVVWKPSEKTPLAALACEAIFARACARYTQTTGHTLPEGLLHVLHLLSAALAQIVTMPHEAAQTADVIAWTERTVEQAVAVQPLQPLAVFAVGFPAGNVAHMSRVDPNRFQARSLQFLKQRNPID